MPKPSNVKSIKRPDPKEDPAVAEATLRAAKEEADRMKNSNYYKFREFLTGEGVAQGDRHLVDAATKAKAQFDEAEKAAPKQVGPPDVRGIQKAEDEEIAPALRKLQEMNPDSPLAIRSIAAGTRNALQRAPTSEEEALAQKAMSGIERVRRMREYGAPAPDFASPKKNILIKPQKGK